jgi:serine/threonine-protein kinase
LRALAASDSSAVEGLAGSWVPQLSSKRPGLVADGQTYDAASILAEHQALQSRYPDARLVWTGDFANYRGRDFWATLVGEPMPTAAMANAWCDAQGLDGNHCYAVRLTHTGGPAGNSVMRTGR